MVFDLQSFVWRSWFYPHMARTCRQSQLFPQKGLLGMCWRCKMGGVWWVTPEPNEWGRLKGWHGHINPQNLGIHILGLEVQHLHTSLQPLKSFKSKHKQILFRNFTMTPNTKRTSLDEPSLGFLAHPVFGAISGRRPSIMLSSKEGLWHVRSSFGRTVESVALVNVTKVPKHEKWCDHRFWTAVVLAAVGFAVSSTDCRIESKMTNQTPTANLQGLKEKGELSPKDDPEGGFFWAQGTECGAQHPSRGVGSATFFKQNSNLCFP